MSNVETAVEEEQHIHWQGILLCRTVHKLDEKLEQPKVESRPNNLALHKDDVAVVNGHLPPVVVVMACVVEND